MSGDVAVLTVLAALICAVIFLTNAHLSTVRLFLLLLVALGICSSIPAVSSNLGPRPAIDQQGNPIRDIDGKPLYDRRAMNHWARATAAQGATLTLGGLGGGLSMILLTWRGVQWYWEKRDP